MCRWYTDRLTEKNFGVQIISIQRCWRRSLCRFHVAKAIERQRKKRRKAAKRKREAKRLKAQQRKEAKEEKDSDKKKIEGNKDKKRKNKQKDDTSMTDGAVNEQANKLKTNNRFYT